MIVEGRQFLASAWWVATFPGVAIFVTVLGFNLFGDGLRDALDPRLRAVRRDGLVIANGVVDFIREASRACDTLALISAFSSASSSPSSL